MTQKGIFIFWGMIIILMGAYFFLTSQPAPDKVVHPPTTAPSNPAQTIPLEESPEPILKPSFETEATPLLEPIAEAPVIEN